MSVSSLLKFLKHFYCEIHRVHYNHKYCSIHFVLITPLYFHLLPLLLYYYPNSFCFHSFSVFRYFCRNFCQCFSNWADSLYQRVDSKVLQNYIFLHIGLLLMEMMINSNYDISTAKLLVVLFIPFISFTRICWLAEKNHKCHDLKMK